MKYLLLFSFFVSLLLWYGCCWFLPFQVKCTYMHFHNGFSCEIGGASLKNAVLSFFIWYIYAIILVHALMIHNIVQKWKKCLKEIWIKIKSLLCKRTPQNGYHQTQANVHACALAKYTHACTCMYTCARAHTHTHTPSHTYVHIKKMQS